MNWKMIASEKHVWLDGTGPSQDVVLSSRIRLARNLADLPFPSRLGREGQKSILEKVSEAAQQAPSLRKSHFLNLADIKKMEREFLMERHLISPEMAYDDHERGIVLSQGQEMTLMINEEDHLRLQSFSAGLSLMQAWRRADQTDTELGTTLPYAYDAEWGYCTRCPTNAGTGLRASCLLHLPALVMNGDIQRLIEGLGSMGVTARGLYGERSHAMGDLFQISNTATLGRTEPEFIESVARVVDSLLHYERQAREVQMEGPNRMATEDAVFRAWGILRSARLISYDEAMFLLSRVRLGLHLGLNLPVQPAVLNHLILMCQPAHLQLANEGPLKAAERDRFRAELIRQKLTSDS